MLKKYTCVYIISLFLVIGIASIIFYNFFQKSIDLFTSINTRQFLEYTVHNASGIRQEIFNAVSLSKITSERFRSSEKLSHDDILHILNSALRYSSFQNMRYIDIEGNAIDAYSRHKKIIECTWFKRTLLGEVFIQSDGTSGTHNGKILISAPVLHFGKTVGIVQGEYDLFAVDRLANIQSPDKNSYAVLVSASGTYISKAECQNALDQEGKNFLAFMNKAHLYDGATADFLHQEMLSGKSGTITYEYNGERRVACYVPLGIKDWFLVQVVMQERVAQDAAAFWKSTVFLILQCFILFMIVVYSVYLSISHLQKARIQEIKKFETLANNIPGGVIEIVINDNFAISYANDGLYTLSGYSKEDIQNTFCHSSLFSMADPEDIPRLTEEILQEIREHHSLHTEFEITCKNGVRKWISVAGRVTHRGKGGPVVQALVTDVTLQKQRTEQLIENGKYDKMTGLYDKVTIQGMIENSLDHLMPGVLYAIAVIDIDRFKCINDTYGHDEGDKTIIAVAQTLRAFFQHKDMCGRIGGDEFIVFIPNAGSRDALEACLAELHTRLAQIVVGTTGITCSIGGILFTATSVQSYTHLFQAADGNLYAAKKSGKNKSIVGTLAEVR